MSNSPLKYLLDIDQAIRVPGGLRELVHRSPDTVSWLSWIARVARVRTCGALEQLGLDRTLDADDGPDVSQATKADTSLEVILYDSRNVALNTQTQDHRTVRFKLSEPGHYRLLTPDRTLLWSHDLTSVWGTNKPPNIWRLAAAPPESPPEPPESRPDEDPLPLHADDPPMAFPMKPEHDDGSQTLIRSWPIPHWALDVQLYRSNENRWLDVICRERTDS